MTRKREHRIKQQARQAANHDDDLGRERSRSRAEWWVGHLSHELNIVDKHGMIDVDGEVARAFVRAYLRRAREVWPTQGTSGTDPQRGLRERERVDPRAIEAWNISQEEAYRSGWLRTLVDAGLVEHRGPRGQGWYPTTAGIRAGLRSYEDEPPVGYFPPGHPKATPGFQEAPADHGRPSADDIDEARRLVGDEGEVRAYHVPAGVRFSSPGPRVLVHWRGDAFATTYTLEELRAEVKRQRQKHGLAHEIDRYERPAAPPRHFVTPNTRAYVRDYIAVDTRDHMVAGPFKGYGEAKQEADRVRGHVKYVPAAREVDRAPREVQTTREKTRAECAIKWTASVAYGSSRPDLVGQIAGGNRWAVILEGSRVAFIVQIWKEVEDGERLVSTTHTNTRQRVADSLDVPTAFRDAGHAIEIAERKLCNVRRR